MYVYIRTVLYIQPVEEEDRASERPHQLMETHYPPVSAHYTQVSVLFNECLLYCVYTTYAIVVAWETYVPRDVWN
jgi:hypothetical protein